jgi:hypothetical protein
MLNYRHYLSVLFCLLILAGCGGVDSLPSSEESDQVLPPSSGDSDQVQPPSSGDSDQVQPPDDTEPEPVLHPIDGSYWPQHGNDAKSDLTKCQKCHADKAESGPGSNPRFNVGINIAGGNGCESCHEAYLGHPGIWAGPKSGVHYNDENIQNACALCHSVILDGVGGSDVHYDAGNIPNACTPCHGVNLDGVGGVGVSCLSCHAEVETFALDCTSCHGYPPDGTTPEPEVAALNGQLVAHNGVSDVTGHDQCTICHGVKSNNTATSGALTPNANYRVFDPLTETKGDHWNGLINMNGPTPTTGLGYNQTNFGCDNAGCHINDTNHQLSDSALPLAFGAYATMHALDGSFLDGGTHGFDAKSDLAGCKKCHGETTTINPRFNQGIAYAGGIGCEGCHYTGTAHPSSAEPGNINWYNGQWNHTNANVSASTCGLCHVRTGWAGSSAPACTSCHLYDPANATIGSCNSCHDNPPNGISQPNRIGMHTSEHAGLACTACHTNAGPGSPSHFTQPNPEYSRADLRTTPDISGATMSILVTPDNVTCSKTCHEYHGEGGSSYSWY